VGDQTVEGAEIIGFDPVRGTYVTQYVGNEDVNAYEASLHDEDGVLVWSMHSEKDRFRGTFNDQRTVITGHWETRDVDDAWQPWMDVTLTKQPG
jgi:hypothetical protein